jgi:hypothetical protein
MTGKSAVCIPQESVSKVARRKLLSGLKIRAGTRPILSTSKPPPPGMIFPVVSSEAAAPPRNDLTGADRFARAIFARAVAHCLLPSAASKTSQPEQAKQAEPTPVSARPLCLSGCSGSILIALVTLTTCLSQRRQSQRQRRKTQSQYSRSNVPFHSCFLLCKVLVQRYSETQIATCMPHL